MQRPCVWSVAFVVGLLWASRAGAQTEPAPEYDVGDEPAEVVPLPSPVEPEPVAPVEPGPLEDPGPPEEPGSLSEPPPEPEPAPPAPPPPPGREPPDPAFRDWGEPGTDPPPPPAPPFQAAALIGVGASFDETAGGVNPLGFGFGARGDLRLLPELAVGVRFVYFVGGSAALPSSEISVSSWLLAAEASYVYPVSGMVVEPGIALGVLARAIDGRSPFVRDGAGGFVPGSSDDAQVGFYLAPGASLTVPLTLFSPDLDPFFAGADARIGFLFGDDVSGSLELLIQAGLRF